MSGHLSFLDLLFFFCFARDLFFCISGDLTKAIGDATEPIDQDLARFSLDASPRPPLLKSNPGPSGHGQAGGEGLFSFFISLSFSCSPILPELFP